MAMPTHAQIARDLVIKAAPGVFARGALAAVTHHDTTDLERMLPGVRFSSRPTGPDRWELTGVCVDGSTVTWDVGA